MTPISDGFMERELRLIRSYDAANASEDVLLIESEFDALPDTMVDL